MSTFSSAWTSRARASETSFTRESDKIKLRKLRDSLAEQGKLPPKSASWGALPTVDQLAEISANAVPYTVTEQNVEPDRLTISVSAPDPATQVAPELPSTSAVVSEIYREHTGKKVWFNTLTKSLAAPPLDRRVIDAKTAARIERQAPPNIIGAASMILGSFLCLAGAGLAGVALWRWNGKRNSDAISAKMQESQTARFNELQFGAIGQSVRAVGEKAEQAIGQHEGYKSFGAGLKEGRVFRHER